MSIQRLICRWKGIIGKNTYVDPTAQIIGWDSIRIGKNSLIGEHCCVNVNFRDALRLTIGDNCFVGRRNFFTTGDFVELGDYFISGPDCYFLGASHVQDPRVPYITTGIVSYGRLIIGANCLMPSNVTILGGVTIGYGCIFGAHTLVRTSLPPLCVVVGNPARVVKVFDWSEGCWRPLTGNPEERAAALEAHAAAVPSEEEYLALLRARHPVIAMPKVAAGIPAGEI